MTYKEALEEYRAEWIGREISYMGERHKIVDIDHNFAIMIDKPARFTDTTAVDISMIDKVYD